MSPLPAAGSTAGYVCRATTEHADCHSSSVHSRAPTDAQAAAACGAVTLVHGITPGFAHGLLAAVPCELPVAPGRDASYAMIWRPLPIATQAWPERLPVSAPSSTVPLQLSSRPLHDSGPEA